jgi:hypothetical protein
MEVKYHDHRPYPVVFDGGYIVLSTHDIGILIIMTSGFSHFDPITNILSRLTHWTLPPNVSLMHRSGRVSVKLLRAHIGMAHNNNNNNKNSDKSSNSVSSLSSSLSSSSSSSSSLLLSSNERLYLYLGVPTTSTLRDASPIKRIERYWIDLSPQLLQSSNASMKWNHDKHELFPIDVTSWKTFHHQILPLTHYNFKGGARM